MNYVWKIAPTVNWLTGASGNWSDPGHWAAGAVPLTADDVLVTGDTNPSEVSYVDLDVSAHLGALTVDASASGSSALVSVRAGNTLTLDGALTLTSNASPGRGARFELHDGASLVATGGISLDAHAILTSYGPTSGSGAPSTVTAAIRNDGVLFVTGRGTLAIKGSVTGAGHIEVFGGALDLDGSTGEAISLLGGASLTLEQASAVTSQVLVYGDTVGTLDLKGSSTFGGALTFSHAGGTLDLAGVAAQSTTLSGSKLHIVETDGSSLDLSVYLSPLGNPVDPTSYALPAGYNFSAVSDGAGGTVLSFSKGITQTWAGGAVGDWSDPGNWASGKVPGAGDDVVLAGYGQKVVVTRAVAAASLDDTSGIVSIEGGSLTLTGALALHRGALNFLNGGTVTAAGGLTVDSRGSIAASADHVGHTAVIHADIRNDGAIYAGTSSGLVLDGAVSGSGFTLVNDGATLEVTGAIGQSIVIRTWSRLVLDDAGAVTSSLTIGQNDTLDLKGSTAFGGTLLFDGVTDTLDLVGVTSATLTGTALHVTTATNQTFDLKTLYQGAAAGPDYSLYARDDGAGGTIVSIRSTVEHAPVAQNGQATVQAGSPTFGPLPILLGGTDEDGDPVSITSLQAGSSPPVPYMSPTQVQGAFGTLTVDYGTVTYRQSGSLDAVQGSHPVDTFQYTVSDDRGGTGTGTVSITINRAATPVDDSATARGASLSVDAAHGVLANDVDPDGDSLSVTSVYGFTLPDPSVGGQPINGQPVAGLYGDLTLNSDGSYSYTVTTRPTFAGAHDVFTYTVSDGSSGNAALDPNQPLPPTAVLDISVPLLTLAQPTLTLTKVGAGATPVVAGTAPAGSTVTLTDGGTGMTLGTVTADASTGAFAITGTALDAGEHVLTATAAGTDGGVSPASAALTIEVGTAAAIAGQLDALQAKGGLSAIYLTDTNALPIASRSLIADLVARDPDALAAIQGGALFAVTAATGANTTRTVVYDTSSRLVSTTTITSTAGVVTSQVTALPDGSSDSKTFAAGVITGEIVKYAPGGPEISETKVFTAGVLTRDTLVHAGNTKDVYISGVRDQPYTGEHSAYNAAGVLVSTVRTAADGKPTYTYELGGDGTKTARYFDGDTLSKLSIVRPDGSSDVTTYTAGVRSLEAITFAPGGPDIGETKVFTAGTLTLDTIVHADKSKDVYASGVQNRDYANEHSVYNGAGTLLSTVRTTAAGKTTYTYDLASDGTRTTGLYDENGLVKSTVLRADGSSDSKTFSGQAITGEVIRYAPGGSDLTDSKVYTAGVLTRETVVHADGTKDLSTFTAAGAPSAHSRYDAAGTLVAKDVTNPDLSHTVALFASGQSVGSTPVYDDTFSNSTGGGNTFTFAAGFGHDTIKGFHGSASTGHDLIKLGSGLGSDYAHLQPSIKPSGLDTVITFNATDRLVLKNLAPSALSADSFRFS